MRKRVIDLTASATLGRNQSGSLVTLNALAGLTVTLPSASRGVYYDFVVKTTVTSNSYIITTATADKIRGTLVNAKNDTASKAFVSTSSDTITMNGTTTGGLIGMRMRLICDNDGVWNLFGYNTASGSEATPFS